MGIYFVLSLLNDIRSSLWEDIWDYKAYTEDRHYQHA